VYKTKIFTAEGDRHAKDVAYDTKSRTACGCFVDNSKLITDENYVWRTQRNRVRWRTRISLIGLTTHQMKLVFDNGLESLYIL